MVLVHMFQGGESGDCFTVYKDTLTKHQVPLYVEHVQEAK